MALFGQKTNYKHLELTRGNVNKVYKKCKATKSECQDPSKVYVSDWNKLFRGEGNSPLIYLSKERTDSYRETIADFLFLTDAYCRDGLTESIKLSFKNNGEFWANDKTVAYYLFSMAEALGMISIVEQEDGFKKIKINITR